MVGSGRSGRGTHVGVFAAGHGEDGVHFADRLLVIWQAERLTEEVLQGRDEAGVNRQTAKAEGEPARRAGEPSPGGGGRKRTSFVGSRQYALAWWRRRLVILRRGGRGKRSRR